MRVAIVDDWQEAAKRSADWGPLAARAELQFFTEPFTSVDAATKALVSFDIILPMRERTQLQRTLLERLPRLRMLALTGSGTRHVDMDYCNERGILCCSSGGRSPASTAELALGLMLAAARNIAVCDANMRSGGFQHGIPLGIALEGKTLGIIGVGRIGARVASYGRTLGMDVLGWSSNLTDEQAGAAGVTRVEKQQLLRNADVVSLHVVYSPRSHHLLKAEDLALLKPGAILVNTARGPLIEEAALLDVLGKGQIRAALDVYDEEPLPTQHPLRQLSNVVLTPHQGFSTQQVFDGFYQQSVENILGFMDGTPLRVMNPEALARQS